MSSKAPILVAGVPVRATMQDYGKRKLFAHFPFTYPSWNDIQDMHWRARKHAHDKFLQDSVVILKSLHAAPFTKPINVKVDLYFKKRRRRDNDNYGGKWLLDAIRKAGLIPDDSTEWIPGSLDILIIEGKRVEQTIVGLEEQ